MKVLLINPPRTYIRGSQGVRIGLPLGLMYIGAVLEKKSIPVRIFDSLNSSGTKVIKQSNCIFHGVTDEFFKNIISSEKPDIVGISTPFTAQVENTVKAANLIKQVNPNIFVVAGGPHFAVLGKQFVKENNSVDAAVTGEGERAMLELINALENKRPFNDVNGLVFRFKDFSKGADIAANPPELIKDLDSLPFPAYHLIDMERYFYFLEQGLSPRPNKYGRLISMITSRGCPFNCVFCAIHLHMGRPWRAHSVDYVVSHIEYVIDNYKVRHISFEDDNFTFNRQRCEGIIDQILRKRINITWNTPNGVRADTLTENLLIKMKKSNCQGLIVAAESGDQSTLDNIIRKNLKLENIVQVAGWCKKLKIKLESSFIIGLPGETKSKIQKTIDFAFYLYKKFNVKSNLMVATPLFGTELYDIVVKNNYLAKEITPENLAVATQSRGEGIIRTSEFNPQDLKKFAKQLEARITRIDLVRKITSPSQYFKILKMFFAKPRRLIFYLKRLRK